jgi:hypothetical protein
MITEIKEMGRYRLPSGQKVNIKRGRKKGYGVDVYFYLYRGKRQFVSDAIFFSSTKIS